MTARTAKSTRRDRLEAAGFRFVSGWLPADRAEAIGREIERQAADAERIAEAPKPQGRPRRAKAPQA
jgi:hypothetical protein